MNHRNYHSGNSPTRPIDVRMTYEDLKIICDMVQQKRECFAWHYSDKERPDKAGEYWCVLIYDEWEDNKPTGRKCAVIETRYFEDRHDGWTMNDEPKDGLAWQQECGSWLSELVWAWMPIINDSAYGKMVRLPEGVAWGEEV